MDFKELRRRLRSGERGPGRDPASPAGSTPVTDDLAPEARSPRQETAPVRSEPTDLVHDEGLEDDLVGEGLEVRELLRFRLGNERFALDLEQVEEIIKPKPLTAVPRVPAWILGILSLRGTMVPVVDPAQRLGLEAAREGGRIIVVLDGEDPCGLIVDEVRDVERVRVDQIEAVPAALKDKAGQFLEGLVRGRGEEDGDEDGLLAVVHLPALLQTEGD